jgi:hypothetical protein
MKSEGEEFDGIKREKKNRNNTIRGDLNRCLTKTEKEVTNPFMMKSFLILGEKEFESQSQYYFQRMALR